MRSTGGRPAPRVTRAAKKFMRHPRAAFGRDAARRAHAFAQQGRAAQQQHRPLAVAQGARDPVHRRIGYRRRPRHRQGRRRVFRFVPGGIGGQDQGGDLAGSGARRRDRAGGIDGGGLGAGGGMKPVRHRTADAHDVRHQGRVVAVMPAGMIAHDIDDRAWRRVWHCEDWRCRWRSRGPDAARSRRACRSCGHSRRRPRSPRLRTKSAPRRIGLLSSAATKCISDVPGLAKQTSIPLAASVCNQAFGAVHAVSPFFRS